MDNHKQESTEMMDAEVEKLIWDFAHGDPFQRSEWEKRLAATIVAGRQRIEGLERELKLGGEQIQDLLSKLFAERNARAKAEAKVAAVEKEARSLVADFDGWADAGRRVLKVLNALCEHEMPIGTCINCATQSPEPAAASPAKYGWAACGNPAVEGKNFCEKCLRLCPESCNEPAPQPSQALRERPAHQRLAFMLRLYLNVDEGIALQVVNAIDARQLELLAEIEARIALIEDRHAKT